MPLVGSCWHGPGSHGPNCGMGYLPASPPACWAYPPRGLLGRTNLKHLGSSLPKRTHSPINDRAELQRGCAFGELHYPPPAVSHCRHFPATVPPSTVECDIDERQRSEGQSSSLVGGDIARFEYECAPSTILKMATKCAAEYDESHAGTQSLDQTDVVVQVDQRYLYVETRFKVNGLPLICHSVIQSPHQSSGVRFTAGGVMIPKHVLATSF